MVLIIAVAVAVGSVFFFELGLDVLAVVLVAAAGLTVWMRSRRVQ